MRSVARPGVVQVGHSDPLETSEKMQEHLSGGYVLSGVGLLNQSSP